MPPIRDLGAASIALEIARMITDFLGPHFPRRDSVGATLNALRTRLETDTAMFDSKRDVLAWQVREAIRTEFFKIIYPSPPAAALLGLVTRTELLLTHYTDKTRALFIPTRPFYFPGARVAVPTEAGSRRAGTTLQLRFKEVAGAPVTEALLHLDGPNGGGFQWVQTPALTALVPFQTAMAHVARRDVQSKPPVRAPSMAQRGPAARPRTKAPSRMGKAPSRQRPSRAQQRAQGAAAKRKAAAGKAASALNGGTGVGGTHAKKVGVESKGEAVLATPTTAAPTLPTPSPSPPPPTPSPSPSPTPPSGPAALPPTFVPEALLSTSPPPRKRLRAGVQLPVSHTAGVLRRALDVGGVYWGEGRDEDEGEGEGEEEGGKKALMTSVERIGRLVGIERLVARRKIGATGVVEYYVKWSGRRMRDGSWERREALLTDVPALVMNFDIRHPEEPQVVCHSDRVSTQAEMEDANRSEAEAGRDNDSTILRDQTDGGRGGEQAQAPMGSAGTGYSVKTEVVSQEDAKADSLPTSSRAGPASSRAVLYVDEVTGIGIPAYLDTPILEVNFSGMVLQIRRPNEYTLHNDAGSASRDYKKRQSRFKQENLAHGEKLFTLSKPEARAALDASLRAHRTHGRHPIAFPRGLGRASPADHGLPFSPALLRAAPPTWERYLYSVGLRPKHLHRLLPPYFPSLDGRAAKRVSAAARDAAAERAAEHRERARRLVRERFRQAGGPATAPRALFRAGAKRAADCDRCFGPGGAGDKAARGKLRSPRVVEAAETAAVRHGAVAAALTLARAREAEGRWYDAYWSCWRGGGKGSGKE